MGQLDVLGRLMNLLPSGRSGGGSPGDLSDTQKEILKREDKQIAFTRNVVLKYTDLYNNAKSVSEKNHYRQIIEPLAGQLSPRGRKSIEHILQAGLFCRQVSLIR